VVADFRIRGAGEFERIARDLKSVDVRREIQDALDRAGDQLIADARESAASTLPSRGGLAARVAGASFEARVRAATSTVTARITAKDSPGRSVDLKALDDGVVRHPVYGNRTAWATQSVSRGWFSKPVRKGLRKVRDELVTAVDTVTRNITNP
jgi:hypothetical protein